MLLLLKLYNTSLWDPMGGGNMFFIPGPPIYTIQMRYTGDDYTKGMPPLSLS